MGIKRCTHLSEEEEEDACEGVEGPKPLWMGEGGYPLVVLHDQLEERKVFSETNEARSM